MSLKEIFKYIMNHKIIIVVTWKALLITALVAIGLLSQFPLGPDNIIEKESEILIYKEGNIIMDLSPGETYEEKHQYDEKPQNIKEDIKE